MFVIHQYLTVSARLQFRSTQDLAYLPLLASSVVLVPKFPTWDRNSLWHPSSEPFQFPIDGQHLLVQSLDGRLCESLHLIRPETTWLATSHASKMVMMQCREVHEYWTLITNKKLPSIIVEIIKFETTICRMWVWYYWQKPADMNGNISFYFNCFGFFFVSFLFGYKNSDFNYSIRRRQQSRIIQSMMD
jgi:hypothetical protein